MSCVFCKIVAGEIPCYKLYEDDRVLSFLDVSPLASAHTLIIPKRHYETLDAMPADEAAAVGAVLPRLSRAVIAVSGAAGWNVLQNNHKVSGQAVPHVHFHIIPRREGDGLGYRWPAGSLDKSQAAQLVEQLRSKLG